MKILSFFLIISYFIFTQFFQPLILNQFTNISELITLLGSLVGALGSIIGGIIGGIITGFVAFKVANYQIEKDTERIRTDEDVKRENYKRLILNEIKDNNVCLKKIHPLSSVEEINTALKYAISSQIYKACGSKLEVNEFFFYISKYYRILDRLNTDDSIHNEDSISIILEEIDKLIEIEQDLSITSDPTTK